MFQRLLKTGLAVALLAGSLGLLGPANPLLSTSAFAHHLVDKADLSCDTEFPCPVEIRGRVAFWVNVFAKWKTDQIILHDSSKPERVYRVVKTEAQCTDKRSRTVDRHRKGIKDELLSLAKRIDNGNVAWNEKELHLLAMFPSRQASALRKAAKRIRCQQGNRDRFANALERYGRYSPIVKPILAAEGLPADVQYLPFVESAYNPAAYSRLGAAGLWQIMPKTASSLGLTLNATLDERLDPEAATRGAARYLLNAAKRIQAEAREQDPTITAGELNPFVITSYNFGVSGMRRAIRTQGLDFAHVLDNYKSPSFQTAVKNFYASFLAARHVASNHDLYFDSLSRNRPLRYDSVTLKHPTSLKRIKKVFSVDEDRLKSLNPALTRFVWHEWRFLPKGYTLRLPARDDGWRSHQATLVSLKPESASSVSSTYKVKRGDTACGIAHAFRVRCRDLIRANSLGRRGVIRVGQKLAIPGKRASGTSVATTSRKQNAPSNYRVKKGDTACGIARRYGVNCKKLISANALGKRGKIKVGQRLKIPGAKRKSPPSKVTVKKGDTACGIARRYSVVCDALLAANGMTRKSTLVAGRSLRMPGAGKSAVTAAENSPAPKLPPEEVSVVSGNTPGDELTAALDNDLELRARSRKIKGKLAWVIRVEPEETLGHFAQWLDQGFVNEVRKVNGLKRQQTIRAGQQLKLPIRTDAQRDLFESRRSDFHRVLVEQFKEHYKIVRLDEYRVKSGDSAWKVANRHELPVWVVTRFNPQLRSRSPKVGEPLSLPVIQPVSAEDEPPVTGKPSQG